MHRKIIEYMRFFSWNVKVNAMMAHCQLQNIIRVTYILIRKDKNTATALMGSYMLIGNGLLSFILN